MVQPGDAGGEELPGVDTTVPVSARIWNYWLGGTDFYPVDKAAGDEYAVVFPGIFDLARASRFFTARVVRYLAGEAGVRQFLDIGTGLPSHESTHQVAQRVAPDARVVYADRDPLVLSHARALLASSPPGSTDYIEADLDDPASILDLARAKLDFTRPVAIMLMGVLGHIGNPDEEDDRFAQDVVTILRAGLPAGGYLAINEAVDADPDQNAALDWYNQTGAVPYHVRRRDQILRFFDGLEPVPPGIVPIQDWRPEPGPFSSTAVPGAIGGIGKKP